MQKPVTALLTTNKLGLIFCTSLLLVSLSGCLKDTGDSKELPGISTQNIQSGSQREYYLSVFSTQKEDSDKIGNYLTQKQLRVVASQENGGTRIYAYPTPDKNNLAFIMDEFQQVQKLAKTSKHPSETSVQVITNQNKEKS